MGLREGQITVLIHSGSRGLGYQVCDDYLATFKNAPKRYGFELPDWQLACARCGAPRVSRTWARCARRPISPGATGSS